MNKALFLISIACGIAAFGGVSWAEDTPPPRHSPIWTDHNDHDPGVAVEHANDKARLPVQAEEDGASEGAGQNTQPRERVMRPTYGAGARPSGD